MEELLEKGYPVLVVDTDGEYYGLKEEYELLHAGADEECDIQVLPEHAEKLATLALEENVPVILDVSGFLDEEASDELVRETARHLFAKEKKLKKPFLLVIEECHEYIPEGGGMGETGRMLIKVGKRGRKHGLGIVGISQRPADVKKDFITQANWLVWHRLTWENDTKVVGRIVGDEYGSAVSDLEPGEAFVQFDWADAEVSRFRFKRKRTFDAGATPGLDDFERPELKSVSDALVEDLGEISEVKEQREDRIADLERKLENREQRIAELENELSQAKDVSDAARKLANAMAHGAPDAIQSQLPTAGANAADGDADAADEGAPAAVAELEERIEELETELERERELETAAAARNAPSAVEVPDSSGVEAREETRSLVPEDGAEVVETAEAEGLAGEEWSDDDFLTEPAVAVRLQAARRESQCNERTAERIYEVLVSDAPVSAHDIADRTGRSVEAVHSLLAGLRARELVRRNGDLQYSFDVNALASLVESDTRAHLGELHEQWRA
ncbi:hypothetical protein GCM10009039_29120 [Halocalculus aciditolerans]|uniref:DNA helicase n=2 Tax=Halocalculus aciditolerans TaxID=1383812 RepID=A0A830FA36_9EURY|nr:hypothetical protein GCM10009039_29120 [Halocalculus aciditolerans]